MIKLSSLPTFKVQKPSHRRTRSQSSQSPFTTATTTHDGKVIQPRVSFQYSASPRKWGGRATLKPPRAWPTFLNWPRDVLRTCLYDTSPRNRKRKKTSTPEGKQLRLAKDIPPCSATSCPKPTPDTKDPTSLCRCTQAPWHFRNSEAWTTSNILLSHKNDDVGTCVIALSTFSPDTVLGEYFGEVVPFETSDTDSRYILGVDGGDDHVFAFIDAARVGCWTRFINHSCNSNATFEMRRVGGEVRACIVTRQRIERGEEVTVDYGESYWRVMGERGVFCCCGEGGCRYKKGSKMSRHQKK